MTLNDREELVLILSTYYLEKYGCEGWTAVINRRLKTTLGQCDWATRTIEIGASHIAQDSLCSIILTILHECSHALVGPDVETHGRVWDSQYQELKLEY